jgi:hypothetical protein
VAKKPSTDLDKLVNKFLSGLLKPDKLARFMENPERVMEEAKIPRKVRVRIRDEVALEVSKRLVSLMSFHEHH